MSHPEESAPCFNSAHTHANSATPMTHFLCTGAARILWCAFTGNSTATRWFFFFFHVSLRLKLISLGVISDAVLFYFTNHIPEDFLHIIALCVCVCGGVLNLCSLDLIVFSLLLPRLSTSTPRLCQKIQASGMRVGSYTHRKEAKADDVHMADRPCNSPESSSEVVQTLE